jgi:signal transduction histidine kinase
MTQTVIQKTLRGLIAAGITFLLTLAGLGFLSYRLTELDHWTIHTHQVIEELKDSLVALLNVETGDRGYLLARDKIFLEPFTRGKSETWKHLEILDRLTADNPQQQKRLAELRRLAKAKIEFADQTISSQSEMGKALVAEGKGKRIMDEYRIVLQQMIDSETTLLDSRVRALQVAQQALWVATAILTLLGGGILGWVFNLTRTAIEDEKRRVEMLNEMNANMIAEIDQRKRTEKALKETTVKLTSSNADLQRFAYVASHDLQEPLRAVAGFVTLIANKHKGTLDEESEGWITHAVEGSQRMRSLINDLLAYARVESRGKALERIDVNRAFNQAKKDLSVALEESNVDLTSSDLPELVGDEGQLTQVFQNLIGNAIKFKGYEKPVVRVSATKQNGEWLFSVKDNGIGFEPEHVDRIFIIFQRLHGRDEYKGTGIGLALCKKIIERHGGRIWAESAKGEGSTFYFTIPAQQEPILVGQQEAIPDPTQLGGNDAR